MVVVDLGLKILEGVSDKGKDDEDEDDEEDPEDGIFNPLPDGNAFPPKSGWAIKPVGKTIKINNNRRKRMLLFFGKNRKIKCRINFRNAKLLPDDLTNTNQISAFAKLLILNWKNFR